jgi:hypothetical protein
MSDQAAMTVAPIVRRKRTWAWAVVAVLCLIAAAVAMWQELQTRRRWDQVDGRVRVSEAVPFGNGRFRIQIEVTYPVDRRA